jgi:predicted flavoprotein YhiN
VNDIFDIAIIGGGPAGMMAGISAKNSDNRICLLEKNNSLGRKLLLTGKGRCNVTTSKDISEIIEAFGKKGKFLSGALSRFSNQDLMDFFRKRGVELKVERGERVFPKSDKAETILNCLRDELKEKKVRIFYDFSVNEVSFKDGVFEIISKQKETSSFQKLDCHVAKAPRNDRRNLKTNSIYAKKIVIATGGKSYPQTGSTGDGYKFAKKFGHSIMAPVPALASLIVENKDVNSLAGLSLKNVSLRFLANGKIFSERFGEMLFTHHGISGPIVLPASRKVYEQIKAGRKVMAQIDLKPALDESTLKKRIHREIEKAPKKEFRSLLNTLLPRLLVSYFLMISAIDKHQQNSTLTKLQVESLISYLKNFEFEITKTAPLITAIVTHGGVPINEINPKTMESKIASNIFFAGEIIALDGPTGGFNLQKAFSTGWVAGKFASGGSSLSLLPCTVAW